MASSKVTFSFNGSQRGESIMKKVLLFLLYLSLIVPAANATKLGLPAYSYPGTPGSFWGALNGVAPGSIFILNLNSGPGASSDPQYVTAVNQARQAGVQIYGYVRTNYASVPEATVISEVDTYRNWYNIQGIFLDEASFQAQNYNYYRSLLTQLRQRGLRVAMNPGISDFDSRFMGIADEVVTFEGTYQNYLQAQFPRWTTQFPARKFWHLIHGVPDAPAMQRIVKLAQERQAGVVYATDDLMPNPWDVLPSFWQAENRMMTGN
jgi:hypothetical protein